MVAIGTVPDSDFQDMQRPLDPQPARVVKLPLVSIDAGAELILSDLNEKPVAFSRGDIRSEEHTSELQSLMRISYAVFCLNKKKKRAAQTTRSMNKSNTPDTSIRYI